MPGIPEWEYTYRWPEVTTADIEKLEARDVALEEHLRSFGAGCFSNFQYVYRWDQILSEPDIGNQITMLEMRDQDLQWAIRKSGGCQFEYTYTWGQLWPMILNRDPLGTALADTNDSALEALFASCSCGGGWTLSVGQTGIYEFTFASSDGVNSAPYTLDINTTATSFKMAGTTSGLTAPVDFYISEFDGFSWTSLSPAITVPSGSGAFSTTLPVSIPLTIGQIIGFRSDDLLAEGGAINFGTFFGNAVGNVPTITLTGSHSNIEVDWPHSG